MIQKFFENLSCKFRKENSLSDITWCMCEASEKFKKDFLHFFFPNKTFDKIEEFCREYTYDDSRPDFYIKSGGEVFLIEVKIGDMNHHFQQYENTFQIEKENLGYITNYTHYERGFQVKTWKQFYVYLENEIENLQDVEEIHLYKAYLLYLKNVCSIVIIKEKMNLQGSYNLYSFNEILKEVLESKTGQYQLSVSSFTITSRYSGSYLYVKPISENKETLYLWMGLYYERENPEVWLEVKRVQNWGKPFYDILDMLSERGLLSIDDDENDAYWFKFDSKKFNSLFSIEEQKEFLRNFLDNKLKIYFDN